MVRSVLSWGEGHAQPVVLVELQDDGLARFESGSRGKDEIVNSIWELIQQIGHHVPSVAQIRRTHLVFATARKPFLRSPKGNIQRKLTIKPCEGEIEESYFTYGDKPTEMVVRIKDEQGYLTNEE